MSWTDLFKHILLAVFVLAVLLLLIEKVYRWESKRAVKKAHRSNRVTQFPPLTPKDVMELEKLYDKEHKR